MRHKTADHKQNKGSPQTQSMNEPESPTTHVENRTPRSMEKGQLRIKLASLENFNTLEMNLISLKPYISAWDFDEFESNGLHNVDDIMSASSSPASIYQRNVITKSIKEIIKEYKEVDKSLTKINTEMNNGKMLETSSFKAINSHIARLKEEIVNVTKDAIKHYKETVKNLHGKIEESISVSQERLVELQLEADNMRGEPEHARITNEKLTSFYMKQIKKLEEYQIKISTSYGANGQERLNPKGDNLEQIIALLDGVTLENNKYKKLNKESETAEQKIPIDSKNADLKRTLYTEIATQNIRNMNFVSNMPKEIQSSLKDDWDEITEKQIEIMNAINLNKGDLATLERSQNIQDELNALRTKYKAYHGSYIAAESKRRETSDTNILLTDMISTIETAIFKKQIGEPARTDWDKWMTEAKKWKDAYIGLIMDKDVQKTHKEMTDSKTQFLAEATPAKMEKIFLNKILEIPLSSKQINDLAAHHDTSTFSGKFFQKLHQYLSQFKQWRNKGEEYASTFFANPVGVKMMGLTKQLKETHKKVSDMFVEPKSTVDHTKESSMIHKADKGRGHGHR